MGGALVGLFVGHEPCGLGELGQRGEQASFAGGAVSGGAAEQAGDDGELFADEGGTEGSVAVVEGACLGDDVVDEVEHRVAVL